LEERDKNVAGSNDLFGSSLTNALAEGIPQSLFPLVLLDPQVAPDSNAKIL
jgi:hypothetical protein